MYHINTHSLPMGFLEEIIRVWYDQLYAYLETGLDTYITRKGNARTLVAEIDRDQLWAYIEPHIKQKGK